MLRVCMHAWRLGFRPYRLGEWRPWLTFWRRGDSETMSIEQQGGLLAALREFAHPERYATRIGLLGDDFKEGER